MASSYEFPIPKFNFKVNFPSGSISFQEVTGLDQENEQLEYRTGASKNFITEKRAGMKKSGTVSFKKGLIKSDDSMMKFYDNITDKKEFFSGDEPKPITVTLLDEKDAVMFTWTISGAVPIKFSNADLKADENAIAIEQIDIVHSGIKLI